MGLWFFYIIPSKKVNGAPSPTPVFPTFAFALAWANPIRAFIRPDSGGICNQPSTVWIFLLVTGTYPPHPKEVLADEASPEGSPRPGCFQVFKSLKTVLRQTET